MQITPSQDDINEIREIWYWICRQMNEHRITPQVLASRTGYSQESIERGISGEPVPVRHDLLSFVKALGLLGITKDNRANYYEVTEDVPSYDKCKELLKPPAAMPPRQGNFWEYDD